MCDQGCLTYECGWDNGACCYEKSDYMCSEQMRTNDMCDNDCKIPACLMDNGACCTQDYSSCYGYMVGDGSCNSVCNNLVCGFDGGDCGPPNPDCDRMNCPAGYEFD